MLVYSVFNKLSEYTYFYIPKNITSYTFFHVFKIVESLHCIFKYLSLKKHTTKNLIGWNVKVASI